MPQEAPPHTKRKEYTMEVHFGKPVVARVKKCRLVVVKKRYGGAENSQPANE